MREVDLGFVVVRRWLLMIFDLVNNGGELLLLLLFGSGRSLLKLLLFTCFVELELALG